MPATQIVFVLVFVLAKFRAMLQMGLMGLMRPMGESDAVRIHSVGVRSSPDLTAPPGVAQNR